ncbi:MAG: Ni/Fe hydrogenase subunit alpha [Candidatus Bathyarchaeota archaeon]|jgi:F420-non-reducing hydrogenase large subunit|nr:Ni/Fe hydrogenase subunit alpha [Candidatus Bathyarchaeota archaeon A05DMB-5]MDH7558165.1 Ni/Fe hydrogenase subunit alpha [Candidatus Bathyarchaeota archaeon]
MKKILIDPITRLEGHGKISIFLNDKGDVENAYLQVPELRGFERFCVGRKAEDMPLLTSRICGVCPVAHHMAGTKALDAAFNVEPPSAAKKLRELMYCGYFIYDHTLHFYYLGGPDFVVGPDAPPEKRNVIGVIEKAGLEIGKEVIKHRAYGQRITELIGGKATHPVCGLPGGMSKPLKEEERQEIEKMAESSVKFAQFSLKLFHDIVLGNSKYVDLIKSDAYTLKTYYMGTVDDNNKVNFYDGKVRVVDPAGKEFVKFEPKDYLNHISERVEEWTYVKFPYLKKVGWKGYVDGADSGVYRVGPLGRLNASEGMATPLAQEEYKVMYETLGGKPIHSTLAFHWARLIELLYAAEHALELSRDPEITSKEVRNKPSEPGEGVGIVEAARGTLIHHYMLDKDALIKDVNLIVATTNNAPAINMSIRDAAKGLIQGDKVDQGVLNMVEMAFRAYDPCFGCATHFAVGQMPMTIEIYDNEKKLLRTVQR